MGNNTVYYKKLIIKIFRVIVGLLIISIGNVLMIYADLGLNSWGILHQGISLQTPLTFGQASQLLGFSIIVVCFVFGGPPGIGTVLNMYFIGELTDLLKDAYIFATPNSDIMKYIMLFLAIFMMDLGMFIYLKETIGAGPKDGLMILLAKKSGFDMGLVRTCMEVTAVIIGFILGGKFGIGTIIAALTLGPLLGFLFNIFNYDLKKMRHESLFETLKRIKGQKADF